MRLPSAGVQTLMSAVTGLLGSLIGMGFGGLVEDRFGARVLYRGAAATVAAALAVYGILLAAERNSGSNSKNSGNTSSNIGNGASLTHGPGRVRAAAAGDRAVELTRAPDQGGRELATQG